MVIGSGAVGSLVTGSTILRAEEIINAGSPYDR
jgi:hypothetical protein